MLFSKDFRRLLIVCLKMLFRKTTRKRFICLVIVFLFMMGFNTYGYIMRYHKTEIQKKEILEEKAFKVFFLRMRTKNDTARFLALQGKKIKDYGSEIVQGAFIYQNNLYIHLVSHLDDISGDYKNDESMELLYDLVNVKEVNENFFTEDETPDVIHIKGVYIDHNGNRLIDEIIAGRHKSIVSDLRDIAWIIRDEIKGGRIDVFNSITSTIVDNIKRYSPGDEFESNPYLSRIENIVPLSFLHILANIRLDNTTDFMDLAESVRYSEEGFFETSRSYLMSPSIYVNNIMYGDMDIYPRYIPVYIPDIITPQWNWMLYQDIGINTAFLDYIDGLHFKGHYMFSYEKADILQDKVEILNEDIRSNHINFYVTDLSMGIAFPFMISLFAFIHLKTEISFLFMFKNRIKEILLIFWLMPVCLILVVKGSVLGAYSFNLLDNSAGIQTSIGIPLVLTFIIAAAVFYPINRWCFSQFTSNNLNLYSLHKGR
ncbi:hypothetical protein ACFLZT_06165 [Thermodesulfobacteriota bacterium]